MAVTIRPLVRLSYHKPPAPVKEKSMRVPKTERHVDRRYQRAQKRWTQEELEYLAGKYGLVSDKGICRHLQRSPAAIHVASVRYLHQSRSMNFYTGRNVAEVLGVADSKTIIYWVKKGWIRGRHCFVGAGLNFRWMFLDNHIEKCLRSRPWLCDLAKMPAGYFRSVVQEEWDNDRWYTCKQAAALLGVKDYNAVHRYIYNRWLQAVRRPQGGGDGKWLIRRSAIEKFLANDPRPEHRAEMFSISRRRTIRKRGSPLRLSVVWSVLCPDCLETVVVKASPGLKGPDVQQLFTRVYTNGTCSHGLVCNLEYRSYQVKEVLGKEVIDAQRS